MAADRRVGFRTEAERNVCEECRFARQVIALRRVDRLDPNGGDLPEQDVEERKGSESRLHKRRRLTPFTSWRRECDVSS